MTLLAGRFAGHLQMELLGGSVGIVAEYTLSQHLVVVGVTHCKRLLLVTREAGLYNRDLLEISWLFSRVTVQTFCLRRMRSVNFPIWRNHCLLRRCDSKLNFLEGVAVLPNQLMPSGWDSNRKSLPRSLCLSPFEGFAIQPDFAGASDNLNLFGLKNGLVNRTQNAGLFGLLGASKADGRSQKYKKKDKMPSY